MVPGRCKTALIVRNAEEAALFQSVLSKRGFLNVDAYTDAELAFQRAIRTQYEFFIVRNEMPQLAGVVFIQKIRTSQNYGLETIALICENLTENVLPILQEFDINYVIAHASEEELVGAKIDFILHEENNLPPFHQEYLQAKMAFKAQMFDVADDMCKLIYKKFGPQEKLCILLGDIAVAGSHLAKGREYYEEAIVWAPASAEAMHKLARVLLLEHKCDEAAETLNKLATVNPFNLELLKNAGLSNLLAGNTAKAAEHFSSLTDLDRTDRFAAEKLAHIAVRDEMAERRCPLLGPQPTEQDLARFLDAAGRRLEAERDFEGALRMYQFVLEPMRGSERLHSLLYNIGLTYVALKNYPLAHEYFREALARKPGFAKAERALAKLDALFSGRSKGVSTAELSEGGKHTEI